MIDIDTLKHGNSCLIDTFCGGGLSFMENRGGRMYVGGVIPRRTMPYTRIQSKFAPKAIKYFMNQAMIGQTMHSAINLHGLHDRFLGKPYRIATVVMCPPVSSGIMRGAPPRNKGDYDNYEKSIADALKYRGVTTDDSLCYFRGPCNWSENKMLIESGVYTSKEWGVLWGIQEVDPEW